MRKEPTTQLQAQKGARLFNEAATDFGNTVYEQADSLEPVARKYKLQVQTSDWIDPAGGGAAGVLANARLRSALFSPDAIQNHRNTDAVEVAPGTLAAARVLEHQPAAQRKLEEVSAEIEKKLRLREAAKLAQKEGAAKLAALRKGEGASVTWGAAKLVSRRNPQGVPPEAMSALSSLDAAKLPGYAGVDAGDAGYVLYKVTRVVDAADRSEAQKSAEAQQLQRMTGALQYDAYLAALRARSKVSVKTDLIEKKQQP
jgi:peptidyl-prolyl cis-trans isomerase D